MACQKQGFLAGFRPRFSTLRVNQLRAPVVEGFGQAPTIALDGDMALSAGFTLRERYADRDG